MSFKPALLVPLLVLALAGGTFGYVQLRSSADDDPVVVDPNDSTVVAEPTENPLTDDMTPLGSPSPVASATPTVPPSPTASPTPEKPAFTYDVVAVQGQLRDLRYYGGPVDGEAGAMLRSAVMAFQKINGLSADGIVGPNTLAALKDPAAPVLKAAAPATRIEVDLGRQVLFYVVDGQIARIMPVSSGNGATYRHESGSTATALTPVGWFEIDRKISGLREAPLGSLYDPMYFYRGWALHGSNSVPAYPASHGCVRLTRWDATWLFPRVPTGTDVYLFGGEHVFTAGSSAPGTDEPAGDTKDEPSPSPSPSDSSSPTESPSSTASPDPSPSGSGSPEPGPGGSPSPSESPSGSQSPSESPSPSPSSSASGDPVPVPTSESS